MSDMHSENDRCPHFGECGGCSAQDIPYPEQLARKEAALRGLCEPFWASAIPVKPSPVIWHYRNKLDFSFGRKFYDEPPPRDFQRETVLGFKRKNRWYWTLDIDECRIGPEGVGHVLGAVRNWARALGLPAYSSRSKDGFLRVLLVREAARTGQRMVVLITNEGSLDRGSFVNVVQGAWPAASVYHGVFRRSAEIAAADELELLDGQDTIEERLDLSGSGGPSSLRFRISPFSFFQTNTAATELLYGQIRAWVAQTGAGTLYDLYGGAGGIAFTCASLVPRVVSVENVPAASADGRHNAALNSIANVEFHTAAVEDFLRGGSGGEAPPMEDATVILDPPRAGLHPKALDRIIALRPRRVIYIACKPENLAGQDMPALAEHYTVDDLCAFDLFPHTPHVELAALLKAR